MHSLSFIRAYLMFGTHVSPDVVESSAAESCPSKPSPIANTGYKVFRRITFCVSLRGQFGDGRNVPYPPPSCQTLRAGRRLKHEASRVEVIQGNQTLYHNRVKQLNVTLWSYSWPSFLKNTLLVPINKPASSAG